MYIEHLHVRHLKLLRDFELDFRGADGEPRMWTVIIGPNGTAKTSILQAIALAAAGPLQVNRLAERVAPYLVDRRVAAPMNVDVTFRFSERASASHWHPLLGRALQADERLCSSVALEKNQSTLTGASRYVSADMKLLSSGLGAAPRDPLDDTRSKNLPHWFVAGYGISRSLPNPQSYPQLHNPSIERLEPLFPSNKGLTSLSFLDLLPPEKARMFAKTLRDTLLGVEGLVPRLTGMDLGGRHGVTEAGVLMERDRFFLQVGDAQHKMPAAALSHGYQSTLAWIADLIGHVMWEADATIEAADIEGLVLIDEIDLYLHPSWQAQLIPALRETFPKLQFVVTTHSPVVLSSLEPEEIIAVDQHPKTGNIERFVHDPDTGAFVPRSEVETPAQEPDPRTMSGADLYRSWFGIDRLTPYPHGQLLREYSMLATDPDRSDEEDAELSSLMEALDRLEINYKQPVARTLP